MEVVSKVEPGSQSNTRLQPDITEIANKGLAFQ